MIKDNVDSKINPVFGLLIGFLIMTIPYCALLLLFDLKSGYEEMIGAFVLAIAFLIVGIIVAIIGRFLFKIRYISLGLLLGGIATILIIKIIDELVIGYF